MYSDTLEVLGVVWHLHSVLITQCASFPFICVTAAHIIRLLATKSPNCQDAFIISDHMELKKWSWTAAVASHSPVSDYSAQQEHSQLPD